MLKIIQIIVGTVLTLAGAIMTPLPPPFAFGLPMLIVGLCLLAPHVPAVQRFIQNMRGRSMKVNDTLIKHRDKLPKIVKDTIDKTHPGEHM